MFIISTKSGVPLNSALDDITDNTVPIKRPQNWYVIRLPRTRAIRALNNIYVINTLSKNAISELNMRLKGKARTKLPFEIPSVDGDRIVSARRRSKIRKLLLETIDSDLYKQSLIAAVAITEGYLTKILRQVLRWYPQKLTLIDKKIDLEVILACSSLNEMMDRIIDRHLNSIFYSSPFSYLKYIEQIVSIEIDGFLQANYAEIKATRDVLVHNYGITNEIYLRKVGNSARADNNEKLPIDSEYFDESIACMKRLISSIYQQMMEKYGETDFLSNKANVAHS